MPAVPAHDGWTVDDLEELPDDGLQYELADGVLLVTPSPKPRHQRVSGKLFILLSAGCLPELEAFHSPLDYQPTVTRSLQPDLLVVRREDALGEQLDGTPLLAVEILSPSTRAKDLILKKALYADSGVPSYWVIDPLEASVVIWELGPDREYEEVARASGSSAVTVQRPFPLTLVPADLTR